MKQKPLHSVCDRQTWRDMSPATYCDFFGVAGSNVNQIVTTRFRESTTPTKSTYERSRSKYTGNPCLQTTELDPIIKHIISSLPELPAR